MNRTICYLLSFALIFAYAAFTANDARGQAKAFTEQEMGAFARTSLQGYVKDVLTEKNVGRYGFRSVGEASAATLGDPLRVHSIDLKELKAYRPGAGLRSMRTDSRTTWYPVIAGNEVRAKLEIVESVGKLMAGSFGAASEARRISAVRQQIPEKLRAKGISAASTMALVKILALKATFIYVESPGGSFLVPAMASPQRFGVENGDLYPADDLLSKMKDQVKDLPDDLVG